jgi:hypothetical protein
MEKTDPSPGGDRMNRKAVLLVMAILIASPFILHLEDSPLENAPKVALLSSLGVLILSVISVGGFKSWTAELRKPRFVSFWLAILILFALAPFVAVRVLG